MQPLLDAILKLLVPQVWQLASTGFSSCISFFHTLNKVTNSVKLKIWSEIYNFPRWWPSWVSSLISTDIIISPILIQLNHDMIHRQQLCSDGNPLECHIILCMWQRGDKMAPPWFSSRKYFLYINFFFFFFCCCKNDIWIRKSILTFGGHLGCHDIFQTDI